MAYVIAEPCIGTKARLASMRALSIAFTQEGRGQHAEKTCYISTRSSAIDRARIDASRVLRANAGFRYHVRHQSLRRQGSEPIILARSRRAVQVAMPCGHVKPRFQAPACQPKASRTKTLAMGRGPSNPGVPGIPTLRRRRPQPLPNFFRSSVTVR